MTANISWVEAKLSDSKVASMVTKLAKVNKIIETGGCACGCGSEPADKSQTNPGVRQN